MRPSLVIVIQMYLSVVLINIYTYDNGRVQQTTVAERIREHSLLLVLLDHPIAASAHGFV